MGVLTDFFVADAGHAASLVITGPGLSDVPMLQAKSVDSVKIASLCRIASGAGVEAGAGLEDVDDPFDVDRPDGPWLVVVRDEATAVIAGIPDDQLSAIAAAWAATEEWQADGAEPGCLETLIGELRNLARAAEPPAERLYLWMSL